MRLMPKMARDFSGNTGPRRRPALIVCLVAAFMTLLDISIVTVALPSMERSLHMPAADVSWAVAGFALTFGLTLVPAGRLGDHYGRRRLFLIGLSLFAITAVLCGAAPDATVLVIGRLARGVAAGLLAPQVIGLMQQMYDGPRRGRAFGYYGATVGLSTAIGPLLGGVILQVFGVADGWRFVFYLSAPVVLVTLALAYKVLPADRPGRAPHAPDLAGALLLGLGIAAIMLPLLQATGTRAHPRFWLFAVGGALLTAFMFWERRLRSRGGYPLVNLRLLTIRSYSVGTMIAAAFYSGFTGIFLVITLFFQQGLGYSALQAALSTLIFTVGSAGSAIISGRIVHWAGRRTVVIGSGVAALGLAGAALVVYRWTGHDTPLILAAPLLVAGCGCGFVISANQTLTLQEITRADAGVAAGIYETGQRIGTALGTALASALFFGELARTYGDFHAAAGLGLVSPAVLVGVAFLIGLIDILRPVRRRSAVVDVEVAARPGADPVRPL
jgi:EmrB/QacA subfamily drug resistance transporter